MRGELLGQELAQVPNLIASTSRDRGYPANADLGYVNSLDPQQLARDMESRLLSEMFEFEQVHIPYFQPLNQQHQETIDYFNSFQWSDEDKFDIIKQGLKPYVNNVIRKFALTLLGEQMARRTMWRASGITEESKKKVEVANRILRWAHTDNKWHMGEHYVFRDGMIGGRGVCSVGRDPRNPLGGILLSRHRPQEFMWHVGTASDPRLKGTKYLWRGYLQTKAQMMAEFPEWREQFVTGGFGDIQSAWNYQLDSFIQPKTNGTMASLGYTNTFDPYLQGAWNWRDWVIKREFYKVEQELRHRVADGYQKAVYDFELKPQAEAFAAELRRYYQAKLARGGIAPQMIAVSDPMPVFVEVIYQTIWAGDNLLRVEKTGHDQFPYFFYIPEWYDGDITSFFQHGKDQQRLLNRQMSYMDQAAGGIKPKVVVNRGAIEDEYTPAELTENLQSMNDPLIVNVPQGKSIREIIDALPSPDMGQIPTLMYKLTNEATFMMFGGENAVGQQQSSQESGKAVLARRAAASLAIIPHLEEFSMFKRMVGEEVLYHAQELDPVVLMMATDGAMDPETNAIILDGIQSIKDLRFSIEIAEVEASPTEKDARLQRLLLLANQNSEMAPYIARVALKYAEVDKSDIDEIITLMNEAKNEQTQQVATAQAHQEDMDNRELEIKYLRELIRIQDAQIRAENPARFNYNVMIKEGEASPALMAELLNREGIKADPVGVAADRALQNVLELERERASERIRAEGAIAVEKAKPQKAAKETNS